MSVWRPLASVLGWVSAVTCALTGMGYAGESSFGSAGPFVSTLAWLGAAALAAVTLWQMPTAAGTRAALMILLSVLAAGFVAANMLALVASSEGVPGVPRTLHLVGTISGSALYLAALVDVSVWFLSARSAPREPMEPAMPV